MYNNEMPFSFINMVIHVQSCLMCSAIYIEAIRRERDTFSHTHTHTHTQQKGTLEKQDKAAVDKTVGGGAWYLGLAEPGKRTVKHNNKRNTTVKCQIHFSSFGKGLVKSMRFSHILCNMYHQGSIQY